MHNFYENSEDASADKVRKSYERLKMGFNSSENIDVPLKNMNSYAEEMAFNVLGNTKKRQEYDEGLSSEISKLPFPYAHYNYDSQSVSLSDIDSSYSFEMTDDSESNISMNSISMDKLGNDCGSDSLEEGLSLERLMRAITEACDRYTRYHQSNRQALIYNRAYFNGYLSFFRHRGTGLQNATAFQTQMDTMGSMNDAIKEIVAFLSSESRAYHTHSLSSYILDEVKTLLEKMGRPGLHTDDTGHYTERDWIWVLELNVIDDHLCKRR